MSLSQTSKNTWVSRIRDQIRKLQETELEREGIDLKATKQVLRRQLAEEAGVINQIEAYHDHLEEIKDLENEAERLRKEVQLTVLGSTHYSRDLWGLFDKQLGVRLRRSLFQESPRYAELETLYDRIPIKIDLITTQSTLRNFLVEFLPTIGIETD